MKVNADGLELTPPEAKGNQTLNCARMTIRSTIVAMSRRAVDVLTWNMINRRVRGWI